MNDQKAQSLISGEHFLVLDAPKSEKPIRYEVIIRKSFESLASEKIGHVVTCLTIQEWCSRENYVLIQLVGQRLAMTGEETDLL